MSHTKDRTTLPARLALGRLTCLAILAWISFQAMGAGSAWADVQLVHEGQTTSVIILPDDASKLAKTAAHELQDYLRKISGAKVAITPAPDDDPNITKIWIGRHPSLKEILPQGALSWEYPEEIHIQAMEGDQGNHLILAGNDESLGSGTTLAVYTFIQKYLGVRWLWPGELGEDIIPAKTISFAPFTFRYHPQIRQRNIRHLPPSQDTPQYKQLNVDMRRWMVHQRVGHGLRSFSMSAGHAFTDWWQRYGKTHPEYFALQPDGTRGPASRPQFVKLCISNPAVHEQWLENAEKSLRGRDAPIVISASPNDSANVGVCTCDACAAWDHPDGMPVKLMWAGGVTKEHVALTNRYVHFWNALARKLKRRFPDKPYYVGAWAYQEYATPPIDMKLEDNLVIGFVEGDVKSAYGGMWTYSQKQRSQDRDMWLAWSRLASRMAWRPNLGHTPSVSVGLPNPAMARAAEDIRFMADHHLIGVDIDGTTHQWATQGLMQYLVAQLLWDPYADYHAILDDYFKRGFGPAADDVAAYFQHMEKMYYRLVEEAAPLRRIGQYTRFSLAYTPESLAQAGKFLDAAARDVADAPDIYKRRVAFIRLGHDFTVALMDAHEKMMALREEPVQLIEAIHRVKQASDIVDAYVEKGQATYALSPHRARTLARDYFGPLNEEYQALLSAAELLKGYEYPFIETSRIWEFKLDLKDIGRRDQWQSNMPDPGRLRVHTDYSWSRVDRISGQLRGQLKDYKGVGWYRTRLPIPPEMKGREIVIFFGGVSDACEVYVNGKLAGQRVAKDADTWKQPFYIPIDRQIDWGKPVQEIVVRVVHDADSAGPGGIYRQPWIISRQRP